MSYRIFFRTLLPLVLVSGCATPPETSPSSRDRAAATVVTETATLQAYRGDRFAFDYPRGWSVSPLPQIRELDSRDVEGIEVRSPEGDARVLIASIGARLQNCYVRFVDVFRVEMQREESVLGWGPYRSEMGGWTDGLINGARGAVYENCIAEKEDTLYVRIVTSGDNREHHRPAFRAIENSFAYRGLPAGFKPARSTDAPTVDSTTFTTHTFRATNFAVPSNWSLHTVSDTADGGMFAASSKDALATISVAHYATRTETAQSGLKHHREQVLPNLGKVLRTAPLATFGHHKNGAGIEIEMRIQAGLDGAERNMNVRIYFVRSRDQLYRFESYRTSDATDDRKQILRLVEESVVITSDTRPIPMPKR